MSPLQSSLSRTKATPSNVASPSPGDHYRSVPFPPLHGTSLHVVVVAELPTLDWTLHGGWGLVYCVVPQGLSHNDWHPLRSEICIPWIKAWALFKATVQPLRHFFLKPAPNLPSYNNSPLLFNSSMNFIIFIQWSSWPDFRAFPSPNPSPSLHPQYLFWRQNFRPFFNVLLPHLLRGILALVLTPLWETLLCLLSQSPCWPLLWLLFHAPPPWLNAQIVWDSDLAPPPHPPLPWEPHQGHGYNAFSDWPQLCWFCCY